MPNILVKYLSVKELLALKHDRALGNNEAEVRMESQ